MTPDTSDDEARVRFVQNIEIIRKRLTIKRAEDALSEALDAAIAAEKELGKLLYDIENLKKNTLTVADYVYGDKANFKAIIDSADGAKAAAVELPNALLQQVGEKAADLADVMNRATMGRGLMAAIEGGNVELNTEQNAKLDELRELINENRENDATFSAKTPYDVDAKQYADEMNMNADPPQINGADMEMDM